MIEAVVFDLDGTLLNTLQDLNSAVNYAVTFYGYQEITLENTKNNIGHGIKNLILKSLNGDSSNLDSVFKRFKDYYFNNYNIDTKPYPGIIDVINYIKDKGLKMAVVSNKHKIPLDGLINDFFDNTFDVIIGDGEGLKRKPEPDVLFECAKRLNVNIDNLVYIGDSDVDVITVKNARCKGIFVDYGYRSKEDLKKVGAQIICSNALDIISNLEDF